MSEDQTSMKLKELLAKFQDSGGKFKAGDLVVWKEGLKNRRRPRYDEKAIVIGTLDSPESTNEDSSSPYFREPLDLQLGILDDDGDFLIYHFDSRRFTKS